MENFISEFRKILGNFVWNSVRPLKVYFFSKTNTVSSLFKKKNSQKNLPSVEEVSRGTDKDLSTREKARSEKWARARQRTTLLVREKACLPQGATNVISRRARCQAFPVPKKEDDRRRRRKCWLFNI